MFSWNKLPVISGITAVFLILIMLTTSACGSEPDPARSAPLPTPVAVTNTPLPPTATAVILSTSETHPTPATQFRHNAEQVLFTPGSFSANLGNDLGANESYLYTLFGLAGQELTIKIAVSHDELSFTLLDANEQELGSTNGNRSISVTFPKDGDYFVKAQAPSENGRRYGYSLEIILKTGQTASAATAFDTPSIVQPTLPPPATIRPKLLAETAVPQPESITFEPGETTTTLSGQIDDSSGKQYRLSATAGQTLTIYANASQPGIIVSIVGQDGTTLDDFRSGEIFSEILPTTQDYFINLTPQTSNASLDYSMTVAVLNPSSSPNTAQNTIRVNANPATFNDTLYYNMGKTYLRDAEEGQTLLIDATPADSNITISVRGADNTMLGWVTAGTQFSAGLPTTQEYIINLMLPADVDQMDYELTITVQ